MSEAYSLYALNNLVRRVLQDRVDGQYWIQAELSEVRANAAGHCFVEFVQNDEQSGVLIAKARGTIWNNVWRLLKPYFEESTGRPFSAGIRVQVLVSVQFHELYGYSLTVHDVDPTYTLGDLVRNRQQILKQLESEGVLTLNKELPMPELPGRVAVISSSSAAGYGDFVHQLTHHPKGYHFEVKLFPAVMQGDQVEASILSAFDAIMEQMDHFDVVVIIRGGGAVSDLTGFDTYLLASACAQFPLPLITGIGHERDDTVIDAVSHTRVKTPTAAAALLLSCYEEADRRLENLQSQLQQRVERRLLTAHRQLDQYRTALPQRVYQRLSTSRSRLQQLQETLQHEVRFRLTDNRIRLQTLQGQLRQEVGTRLLTSQNRLMTLQEQLIRGWRHRFTEEQHRLAISSQRLKDASPERLLARGYSLTLKEGRIIKEASQLNPGDQIETRFRSGSVTSTVTEKQQP